MSNREQLFEKYEDALFSLLMDDLAEVEGERLLELNEELKKDPDAAVPIDVQQRCIDVINREFAKKKRTASRQRAKKVLKILPWAVVIAMALMAVAMAAFPSFRAGIYSIIKFKTAEYSSWQISEQSDKIPENVGDNLSFSIALPAEYNIEEVYSSDSFESADYKSSASLDSEFTITVFWDSNTSVNLDTEGAELYKSFSIMGSNADVYTKGARTRIIWAKTDIPAAVVVLESNNIEVETIISIANSFRFK